jgi:glutamyl-tRNA synthetase
VPTVGSTGRRRRGPVAAGVGEPVAADVGEPVAADAGGPVAAGVGGPVAAGEDELRAESIPGPPWPAEKFDPGVFESIAPLVQERVATLAEVPAMVDFLFLADPVVDEGSWEKAIRRDGGALEVLDGAVAAYSAIPADQWSAEEIRAATEALGAAMDRKLSKTQAPVRVAVTGRTVGPPLFESLALLGRDEVIRRLELARAHASAHASAHTDEDLAES